MSSESDFDINDSDAESVEKVRETAVKSSKIINKKRTKLNDDESSVDIIGSEDSDQDDFEDVSRPAAKRNRSGKALSPKESVTSKPTLKITNTSGTSRVCPEARVDSTASSSSSSSSMPSSMASSSHGGGTGGDITRGANITTESAAKKLILQYLRLQNRPYSAIQIFDNLHKRIAKPTVERCLATLSEPDGGLRCKEYGKAKIYFFDQKNMSEDLTAVQMEALDKTISDMKSSLDKLLSDERKAKAELESIKNEPADCDLEILLNQLIDRVAGKRGRVEALGSSTMAPDALKEAVKAHNFFRDKWRSRKDALMEVIDAISDGMEKKSSVVMAGMGIETDGDVAVAIPAVIPDIL